jgi:hypothetical protein
MSQEVERASRMCVSPETALREKARTPRGMGSEHGHAETERTTI